MSLANDPLRFILYIFPWGETGTELENYPDGPDKWQRDLLEDIKQHIIKNDQRAISKQMKEAFQAATVSGHGIGKSSFVAWLIIFFMSTRQKCRGVVTANTANQLEGKTWAELSKWHNMALNRHWFKYTATKFSSTLDANGEKNWMFECVPWSEDRTEAFAGLHNASSTVVVIFDEASAISDKIWEVSEGAMTDGEPFWFAFGNGTRNTGRFRECFSKFRHRWRNVHVDSRQVKITNKVQIAKWVEDYGDDSDFVRVRVKGQFPRAGNLQFIGSDLVEGAVGREAIAELWEPLVIGVDVARYGDDQSIICVRKGRDARTHPMVKFRKTDTMTLAAAAVALAQQLKADAIFVDGTGVGGGVVDRIRQLKMDCFDINFSAKSDNYSPGDDSAKYANKRSEMWGNMKDWLKRGAVADDNDLKSDLMGVEYGYDERNCIQLEKKKDMKKRGQASPDNADALALTFAYPVEKRKNSGGLHAVHEVNFVSHEYDPLADA